METYKYKASNGTSYTLDMFNNGNDIYGRNFDFSTPIRLYGKKFFLNKIKKQFISLVEMFVKNPYEKEATKEEIKKQEEYDAITSVFVIRDKKNEY